jgi:RNA polymerase sigma-70 factor (ECF subfamily)
MEGAPPSCETLVEEHLDALHGYALYRTRSADLAQELVQRAFLKAFENRHRLRNPDSTRPWLLAILRNELAMERRSRARFVIVEADDFEAVPDEADNSIDPEFLLSLPEALSQLSDDARDILALRFQQELGYEAIAELLSVPLGTVQSRIHRAKLALKTLLQASHKRGGVA